MVAQTVATKTMRPYQEQLFLYAKDRDCIINLQTGAGKTFIAIMLMKQFADELDGELGKRIFFLAPTKPLVAQQAAAIREDLAVNVAEFTGSSFNDKPEEDNTDKTASETGEEDSKSKKNRIHIDHWDFKTWIEVLKDIQVVVMTPKIFLNAISHGCIPLDRVHSIIFDEAHHAGPTKKCKNTKDPYKLIMDIVNDAEKVSKSRPRIWGLTGSLIKSRIQNPEKVWKLVEILKDIFKAPCISADQDLLGNYGTNPNEELWLYPKDNLPSVCSTVTDLLTSMADFLDEIQKELKCYTFFTSEFPTNNDDDDFVPSVKSHSNGIPISLGDFKRNIVNIAEILKQMGPGCALSALKYHITHLDKTLELFEGMDSNYDAILNAFVEFFSCCCDLLSAFLNRQTEYDRMFTFVSTKMLVLLEILKKYKCIGTPEDFECNLAGIIFIEKRAECKALCEFLQNVCKYKQYSHIKVDYIVGSAAQPGFKTILAERNAAVQKQVLKAFKKNETNLLVATSVLEEGLDVPRCNVVVRYDAPKTYRQWKQSKGRARKEDSRYIMMCEKDGKNDLKGHVECYRQTENMLDKINKKVEEFIDEDEAGEEKENYVQKPDVLDDEADLENQTGAKITLDSSAAIVQMYCNRLPHDSFTKPLPFESFKRKTCINGDAFRCKIQMPLNCAIPEPVIGPWKSTTDKARKCTYLCICKILYEFGELDEHLIPKKKQETVKSFLQELDLDFDEELKGQDPKPGTRGRREKYPRFTDILLSNSVPLVSDCECVLFLVEMTPNGYECHPSANEKKLGFLTSQIQESQRVNQCSFPIFSKEGQIVVVFKMEKKLILTPGQLKALRQFYENTYVKALRGVYKDENQLDPDYFPSYYFVPLTGQNTVDWACIEETNQSFLNTDRIEAYDLLQTKHSLDEYIVYTTYKKLAETGEEQPGPDIRFYLVKKTASEKMPTSKFPRRKKSSSKEFDTFIDYYQEEYNLIVKDRTKPLFEAIPAGFSFFTVSTLRKKPHAAKNVVLHLVPEFCGVLPFPASYWFKLTAIPAIVFRLNSLLSSKSLKEKIERLAFNKQLQTKEAWQKFDLSPADCAKYGNVLKDETLEEETHEDAKEVQEEEFIQDDDAAEEPMEVSSSEDEEHVSDVESSPDESPSSSLVKTEVVTNKNLTIVEPKLPSRTFPASDETYLINEHFISKYPNFKPNNFMQRIADNLRQAISSLLKSRKELSVQQENIAPVDDDVRPDLSTVIDRRVDSFDPHAFGETKEGPSTLLILQALTARHAHEFFNFERLETIGDSFLKFSTCCYLYFKYPSMSVDHMVEIKDHNVCNYNLYRLAVKKGIPKCIIYEKFDAKTHYVPPGFKGRMNELYQEISDKSVADSTEALIGAYLIALGPLGAIKFMSWLGIKVADGEVNLNDKHWLPEPPPAIPSSITNRVEAEIMVEKLYRRSLLEKFEERIGYKFTNKAYLVQAFTHNSYYLNTATPCYQRLELLGDAVLDYLITRHIYEDKVKKFSPGDLTNLRQALVSNAFFACMAVKYGYHKHIMSISYDATTAIKTFVSRYNEQDRKLILGSFITDLEDDLDIGEIDVPKLLGDVFESVAGAIFLDSGLSLDVVFTVYYRLIQHELKTFSENIPVAPVRKLFELQGKIEFSKATKLASGEVETTVTLSKPARGLKSFTGVGKTIRTARIAAAKKALKVILKPA